MNYMSVLGFLAFFSSVYSMEIIPFLKKEENKVCLVRHVIKSLPLPKKVRNITISYLARLLQEDKRESEKIGQYSCKINCNEDYHKIARGAAAGTCAGFGCGTMGISGYGLVDSCIWCWSDIAITKLTCTMMVYGLLACGCVGCMTGSACVMTGCAEKWSV